MFFFCQERHKVPIFILDLYHYCRANWNCNGRTSSLGLQPIASTYLRGLLISDRSPIAMVLNQHIDDVYAFPLILLHDSLQVRGSIHYHLYYLVSRAFIITCTISFHEPWPSLLPRLQQDQYVDEALSRIEGASVGRLLDQLSNELIRLQVSKFSAPLFFHDKVCNMSDFVITGDQGCRFMEIIGRAHTLHRALTCTTFDLMFGFWKFCSELRFSTF